MTDVVADARDATLGLLADRGPDATVCPSEVARTLAIKADVGAGASEWRDMMPVVHAAIDRLSGEGRIRLSWKGQTLPNRTGPYRIGRPLPDGKDGK